jgi:hypothetical protein
MTRKERATASLPESCNNRGYAMPLDDEEESRQQHTGSMIDGLVAVVVVLAMCVTLLRVLGKLLK